MLSAALYLFYCSIISTYDQLIATVLLITLILVTALHTQGLAFLLFPEADTPPLVEYVNYE
jgi:hypothetical protein